MHTYSQSGRYHQLTKDHVFGLLEIETGLKLVVLY